MTIPLSALPSLKAKKVRKILRDLGYRQQRRAGSHVTLVCDGRKPITFAFHDRATVNAKALRSMLVTYAGLTDDEVKEVLGL